MSFPGVEITFLKLGYLIYPGFPRQCGNVVLQREKTVIEGMTKNKKYLVGAAVGGVARVVLSDPVPLTFPMEMLSLALKKRSILMLVLNNLSHL